MIKNITIYADGENLYTMSSIRKKISGVLSGLGLEHNDELMYTLVYEFLHKEEMEVVDTSEDKVYQFVHLYINMKCKQLGLSRKDLDLHSDKIEDRFLSVYKKVRNKDYSNIRLSNNDCISYPVVVKAFLDVVTATYDYEDEVEVTIEE